MKKRSKKNNDLKKHGLEVNDFALKAADHKETQGQDWTTVITDPRSGMKKGTNISS